MALSKFVYISEIDNLSDARYAAGMGVDLLGFNLDSDNERALNKVAFGEIREWISGVKIVGEFGNTDPKTIGSLLNDFIVDYLLITDESLLRDFEVLGLPLILKINIQNTESEDLISTLNYCAGSIDYFLLDSEQNELSQETANLISALNGKYPILLGHGIDASNIVQIAGNDMINGIGLKGSPELRPGYKDFDELAEILEAIEID